MATIEQLEKGDVLLLVELELARGDYADRWFYAYRTFMAWLKGPVLGATSFYPEDIRPALQAQSILRDYISGKPMIGTKAFRKMRPLTDDVWEFRTPDLRFFGWFHKPNCFVAVSGALFKDLKADKSLYEKHRIAVIEARKAIELDEPKYLAGAGEDDVVSE